MKRILNTFKKWFNPSGKAETGYPVSEENEISVADILSAGDAPCTEVAPAVIPPTEQIQPSPAISDTPKCKQCSNPLPPRRTTYCSIVCKNKGFDGKYLKSLHKTPTKSPNHRHIVRKCRSRPDIVKKVPINKKKETKSPIETKKVELTSVSVASPLPVRSVSPIPNSGMNYERHRARIKELSKW